MNIDSFLKMLSVKIKFIFNLKKELILKHIYQININFTI